MDLRTTCQDVMRCDLCETAVVQMHCDTCLVKMCKACVGEHFSTDLSKPHKIVDFKDRKSTVIYPRCKSHDKETCEMYCTQCDVPVCSNCLASDHHLGHKLIKLLQVRDKINEEQTELSATILPTYIAIASDVQNNISQLEKGYRDLSTIITKYGKVWHREIDKLVKKLKAKVHKMKNRQLNILQKHLSEIRETISMMEETINAVDTAIDSKHISNLLNVPSNLDEYRQLPEKIKASLPIFSPKKLLEDQLCSLIQMSIESDEYGYCMQKTQKALKASSLPDKQMLDEPKTITTVDTRYKYLINVACLSDEEIWTSGEDPNIKLFNINNGLLLKVISIEAGNIPDDIAVGNGGEFIYIDHDDRSIKIVKNEAAKEMIRLQNWIPRSVCSTSCGDIMVIMDTNDWKQSKVVRYSGWQEKRTIQFDDKGNPHYSSGFCYRYITENKNLDICVTDSKARAVVVVNQAGKLRFRYTGHISAPKNQPFSPRGITTDSQSHILTADYDNDRVHIIDQDGQFLRFIDCGLSYPWGMCTNTNDNLFIAQYGKGQVKIIKYYQ